MREADLIRLVRNVIYCGKLREGEQVYKGEHAAIVDADLWQRANAAIDGQPTSAPAEARSAVQVPHRNEAAEQLSQRRCRELAVCWLWL